MKGIIRHFLYLGLGVVVTALVLAWQVITIKFSVNWALTVMPWRLAPITYSQAMLVVALLIYFKRPTIHGVKQLLLMSDKSIRYRCESAVADNFKYGSALMLFTWLAHVLATNSL